MQKLWALDSNGFLSRPLRHYITRNLFSFSVHSKRLAEKNPLLEVISLHGTTGLPNLKKRSKSGPNALNNPNKKERIVVREVIR
jgi:hypothetical protein